MNFPATGSWQWRRRPVPDTIDTWKSRKLKTGVSQLRRERLVDYECFSPEVLFKILVQSVFYLLTSKIPTFYSTLQMPINVINWCRWMSDVIKVIIKPLQGQSWIDTISHRPNLTLLKLKTGLRNQQHHKFCLQLLDFFCSTLLPFFQSNLT